jgi:hypothetical protein
MSKSQLASAIVILIVTTASSALAQTPRTSFFITSVGPGNGAALGGLAGADRHCQMLADAAGFGDRTWRAYLSTTATDGQPAVNARDRIGNGPWYNAKGVMVAQNVADLHSDNNKLGKENSLNEKGEVVNGRGDSPNRIRLRHRRHVRQLDQQRAGRSAARPSRQAGRRPEPELLELRTRLPRLQPGEPARHRRRRPVLLLRPLRAPASRSRLRPAPPPT